MEARYEAFRHERADLFGWEIDDRDHLFADEFVGAEGQISTALDLSVTKYDEPLTQGLALVAVQRALDIARGVKPDKLDPLSKVGHAFDALGVFAIALVSPLPNSS